MNKFKVANLDELLAKNFEDPIEIVQEDVQLLTGPGEHYGSIILRVDLTVKNSETEKKLNLVVKRIPISELLQKAFDVQVTFKKEALSYNQVIPILIDFQKEFNFPEEKLLNCFPKCYGTRYNLEGNTGIVDENAVILFENLKVQGYETIDRLVGFDLEGANVVIRDLARFHAVPLALRLLRPHVFEEKIMKCLVRHTGVSQLGEEVVQVFHNSIMKAAKDCEELKPYLARLKKIVDYYETHPYTIRPEPSKEYGTISHCDLWTSNIMVLKDSKGVIIKDKILDMQLINYSSAIRDLIFFLFTSVQNEFLIENLDNFIKLYHEIFIDTLKYFGIDLTPYIWENFEKELEKVAPDEVYHTLLMLKIICAERGKVTNTLDNFQISDWTRDDLLGDAHKKKLKATVLAFVSRNWI